MEKIGRDFWRRTAPMQETRKRILAEIASAKGGARFSSICKKISADRGAVSGHLKRLEELGVIYRQRRGLYGLATPMFGKYVLSGAGK